MEIERKLYKENLGEIHNELPIEQKFDYDDIELYFNAKKLLILTEEGLHDILTRFINLFILNELSGINNRDGTRTLYRHRRELMEKFVEAKTMLELPPEIQPIIRHEGLKLANYLLHNTLE